jgi:hypothetical protein
MTNQIVWEEPRMKFGKLCYGVTINGQTFWSETKEPLERTVEEATK